MCWSSTTIPLQVHTGCFTYVHFHWGLYLNTFFGPVHTINGNTLFAILIFYLKKAVNKLSASKVLQSQLFVLVCRLPHAHNKNVMWSPQNGSALDIDQFHQLVNFTMFIRHANSTYEDCGKFWWLKNSKKAVNYLQLFAEHRARMQKFPILDRFCKICCSSLNTPPICIILSAFERREHYWDNPIFKTAKNIIFRSW